MKTILQNIFLLLIALLVLQGGNIVAEESNMNDLERQFDFHEVATFEPPVRANTGELELIKNNLKYVFIIASLYAFSLIIITLLMRMTPSHQAKDIVTAVGLVSVIFGTIILVLVVDTSDALTAPMGILGAIAGYLFGTVQKTAASG